jgi:hypothetical protein
MAEREIDPVSTKTSEDALAFVRKMQEAFPETPRSDKERAAVQKYLAQFTNAELRAIGRRVLSDLMQRPPRTIKAGDLPPEPPARPEPRPASPPSDPSVGPKTRKGTKLRGGPARGRTAPKPRRARRRTRRS